MNRTLWFRLSLIYAALLLACSCQQEPKVIKEMPLEKASVPCDFIHDAGGYVDCIYRMNPDTQSIMIELGEDLLPDLTSFKRLTKLWITCHVGDCFTTFSSELLKLKGLKHLIISKSALASIPEEISRLENLETLTIGGRWRLRGLPKNLNLLKKLMVLNVWRNNLNGDSLNFAGMDALELVVIGDNDRVDLPKLKRKWPKLKIVDYHVEQ